MLKKYGKIVSLLLILLLTVLQGCTQQTEVNESSVQEVSVVSRTLTAYEKKVLEESVESPLNMACTTLYECVCTGSITKKSAVGKFSFADKLPLDNTSPSERRKMADTLTLQDAIEYFQLEEIYSDENIHEYGYLSADFQESGLIQGTVINIKTLQKVSEEYIPFKTTAIQLGDFIQADLLLSR